MPNLAGINVALSAVLAQSQAMQVVEHNIANANTPGYRRQTAIMTASVPASIGGSEFVKGDPGQIGTGVTIDLIQRFNLQFFDGRYRSTSAEAKNWEARSGVLTQAEAIMAETSADGLLPKMDEFWASWESLSTDPTNDSLRMILLDNATSLASGFSRRIEQLTQLRSEQDLAVTDQVGMINSLATKVASLNSEISHVLSVGEQPNDLLDKRDLALDQLSQLSGAVSFDQKFGQVTVSIGGHVLVVGNETFQLATKTRVATPSDPVLDVVWADGQALLPPSGSLRGILDGRDTFLQDQMAKLDELALRLSTDVNALHTAGFDKNGALGLDFFVDGFYGATNVVNARNIEVNKNLYSDTNKIAVADVAGEAGNNVIAFKIANLKFDKKVMSTGTGTVTMNEFYNGQVTGRALDTQRASENTTQRNIVMKSLEQLRESAAGVSLDEEAANMAKIQKAYQAAARVLTAYDEFLDIVINRMGLVGR